MVKFMVLKCFFRDHHLALQESPAHGALIAHNHTVVRLQTLGRTLRPSIWRQTSNLALINLGQNPPKCNSAPARVERHNAVLPLEISRGTTFFFATGHKLLQFTPDCVRHGRFFKPSGNRLENLVRPLRCPFCPGLLPGLIVAPVT